MDRANAWRWNTFWEMVMKKQFALGLVLSVLTVTAHAYQTSSAHNLSAEVLLGLADQRTDFGGGDRASDTSTSYGVRAAYAFNPNVAAEFSYQYYGSYDDSWQDKLGRVDETFTSSAFLAGLKVSLPLSGGYSLVGRLGAAYWDFELEETDEAFPGEIFIYDDRDLGVYYGVGLQLDITQTVFISVEFTGVPMTASFGGYTVKHRADNFSASLGFRF